jgi:hypothetical protein
VDKRRREGGPVGGELAQLGDSEGVDEVIVDLGEAAGFSGLRIGVIGEEVADFGVVGKIEGAAVETALEELGGEFLVGEENVAAGRGIDLDLSRRGVDCGRGTIEDVAAEAVSEVGGEEVDEDSADSGGVEAPAAGGVQDGVEGEEEVSLGVPIPAGQVKAEDDGVGKGAGRTAAALDEDLGDGGGADVDAGGEVAGDRADEEGGEVGEGLAPAVGGPVIPGGDVEGVLEDRQVGLEGLRGSFGLLLGVVASSPTQG